MLIPPGREAEAAVWARAAEGVRAASWFAGGGWLISQMGPTGFQLSKRNWFNDDGHGIHFETWTTPEDLAAGAVPFQCHIMHAGRTFPGTGKKAAAVSRPVLARCGAAIRGWGYHTPRTAGMSLCSARLPFDSLDDLPDIVARECSRFATTLAPVIDEMLACVLAGRPIPRATGAGVARAAKPRVPEAWGTSILPPFESLSDGSAAWQTATEARGEIAVTRDKRGTLRVTVGPRSRHGYHATLRCRGLAFTAGASYRVSFTARAATQYRIAGNIRQAAKPFLPVGFFPGLTIGTDWQTHTWTLIADRTEPDACITFALGQMPNTIWLKDLSVQRAA
ncbi:MAG TPA: hypothetical protein VGN72_18845 [Tepidisphaeraceae bacterium]|jgi:hypothetical protein|nr:hypothetical protein [Tepidisphaeraceae bacterium]